MSVNEETRPADVVLRATRPEGRARPPWAVRLALVVAGLGAWFGTQAWLGAREVSGDRIGDALHELSAPLNTFLNGRPTWANGLLIVSSAVVDLLGIFLLVRGTFGPSIGPFLGLLIVLALRQLCQGLCALPPPDGIIWRSPGIPSLLVTYGVANDLFFSGHTAVAVFGGVELWRLGWRWLKPVAVALAVFEAAAVLVLRAHYTMDVFTGAITALLVAAVVTRLASACDRALCGLRKEENGKEEKGTGFVASAARSGHGVISS